MTNIIDLFSGPGGLGEGFSAFKDENGERAFSIRMAVEKEPSAHKTLELRAFLRRFVDGVWPEEYAEYLRGTISRKELFRLYPVQAEAARVEVLGAPAALGEDNARIHARLSELMQAGGGQPWVVIGGPPCQAYSLVGRSRNRGKVDYCSEEDERNFLYREYLKVLARVRPRVFVMENVRGMLSAKVGGRRIFHDIIRDLRNPAVATGYGDGEQLEYKIYSLCVRGESEDLKPADFVIRSEQYGVPQARHRVILLGVRNEIDRVPELLQQQVGGAATVEQVIGDLPRLRSRLSKGGDSAERWRKVVQSTEMVVAADPMGMEDVVFEMALHTYRLGHGLPNREDYYRDGVSDLDEELPARLNEWLHGQSQVLTGHYARGHMPSDLQRYFFAACWAELHDGVSPRSGDYPEALAPAHANWKSGNFADRFRVQAWDKPSTTITSHISKDGHYYIHPDPEQCRSLTPREAARLQTFPDDYFFEGNRTQQYVQIGNAVPPYLAVQIAEIVHEMVG